MLCITCLFLKQGLYVDITNTHIKHVKMNKCYYVCCMLYITGYACISIFCNIRIWLLGIHVKMFKFYDVKILLLYIIMYLTGILHLSPSCMHIKHSDLHHKSLGAQGEEAEREISQFDCTFVPSVV